MSLEADNSITLPANQDSTVTGVTANDGNDKEKKAPNALEETAIPTKDKVSNISDQEKFIKINRYGCSFKLSEVMDIRQKFPEVMKKVKETFEKMASSSKTDVEAVIKDIIYILINKKSGDRVVGIPLLFCHYHKCHVAKKYKSNDNFPFLCDNGKKNIMQLFMVEVYSGHAFNSSSTSIIDGADIGSGPVADKAKNIVKKSCVDPSDADIALAPGPALHSNKQSLVPANKHITEMVAGLLKSNELLQVQSKLLVEKIESLQQDMTVIKKGIKVNCGSNMIDEIVLDSDLNEDTDLLQAENTLAHAPPIPAMAPFKASRRTCMTIVLVHSSEGVNVSVTSVLPTLQKSASTIGAYMYNQDMFLFQKNEELVGIIMPVKNYQQDFANGLLHIGYNVRYENCLSVSNAEEANGVVKLAKEAMKRSKFNAALFLLKYLEYDAELDESGFDMQVLYDLCGTITQCKKDTKSFAPGTFKRDRENFNSVNFKGPKMQKVLKEVHAVKAPGQKVQLNGFKNKTTKKYHCLENLKILFVNVQGNLKYKLPTIARIYCPVFDIIIIGETWHDYSYRDIIPEWVIGHSHKREVDNVPRAMGRDHGGLLFLLKPSLRQLISKVEITVYTISVRLGGITVTGVYLPPTSLSTEGVKHIFDNEVSLTPDVIIGDFNFDPLGKKPESREIKERKTYLVEKINSVYRCHFVAPTNGTLPNDHAFCKNNLLPNSALIYNLPIPTDHPHGLSITVSINCLAFANNDLSIVRFNLSRLDLEGNEAALQRQYVARVPPRWLRNEISNDHQNYIQFIESCNIYLTDAITQSCLTVLGLKQIIARSRFKTKQDKQNISELAKEFKKGQTYSQNVLIQSRDASLTASEDVTRYFTEIFQQDQNPLPKHYGEEASENAQDTKDLISGYFNPDSILSVIKSYSNTKSCGKDGIHVSVLKSLTPKGLCEHLSRLFLFCVKYGYTPSSWNETITMPVPKIKPDQGALTIDQCRPIGLTVMFRRIFESCLVNLLTLKNPVSDLITTNYGQGGFKRDSSTILQALAVHDCQRSQKGIMIFIDYKWAFDSGRPSKMLDRMRTMGVPNNIVSVQQSLYYGGSTQVVVNGALTDTIDQHNGFTQGGPSSPVAWNYYIDPLAIKLNGDIPRKDPVGNLWADDVCLRFNRVVDVSFIQSTLDTVTEYGTEYSLKPSITKCGVILHTSLPTHKQSEARSLKFHNNTLPVVKLYKYLGFDFDQNGINIKLTAERIFNKAFTVLQCLERAGVTWSPFERLIMFKIFCLSIPLYLGPILALQEFCYFKAPGTPEAITAFTKLLNGGLKWVFSCNNITYIERNLAGFPEVRQILYNSARTLKRQVSESRTTTAAVISYNQVRTNATALTTHELIPKLYHIKFPEGYPDKSLKVAIQNETLKNLLKEGTMGAYCTQQGRGENGSSRELKLKCDKAHLYIKWRRNKPLPIRCPVCDERRFSRKCYKCLVQQYGELPPLFKSHFVARSDLTKDITALDIALNIEWYDFFDAAIDGRGWLQFYSKRSNASNGQLSETSISDLNEALQLEIPEFSEDFIDSF